MCVPSFCERWRKKLKMIFFFGVVTKTNDAFHKTIKHFIVWISMSPIVLFYIYVFPFPFFSLSLSPSPFLSCSFRCRRGINNSKHRYWDPVLFYVLLNFFKSIPYTHIYSINNPPRFAFMFSSFVMWRSFFFFLTQRTEICYHYRTYFGWCFDRWIGWCLHHLFEMLWVAVKFELYFVRALMSVLMMCYLYTSKKKKKTGGNAKNLKALLNPC